MSELVRAVLDAAASDRGVQDDGFEAGDFHEMWECVEIDHGFHQTGFLMDGRQALRGLRETEAVGDERKHIDAARFHQADDFAEGSVSPARLAMSVSSRRWKFGSSKVISPMKSPRKTMRAPCSARLKVAFIEAALPVASMTADGKLAEMLLQVFR